MKRTIGIVGNVGAEQTVVAPVYEGMVLTHTIRTSRVGGESLTRFMAQLLLESQPGHLLRRRQLHIARQVKEQAACVVPDWSY
jgi:actin-related protein